MDFADLNISCPKDTYPLPDINFHIDECLGYHILSFMDSYSRYKRIQMDSLYTPKTTFIFNHSNYYYNVVPFDLNNACATYQWLMNTVFFHQIWRILEFYVDDMIVKTTKMRNRITDLEDDL